MIIELEKELVKLPGIKKSIEEMGASLDRDRLEKELNELEYQMQEAGFWDDIKRAEEVTKKSKLIKDKIENFDKLKSQIEDIEVLKEIMEDDDEESANEIIQTLRDIQEQIDDYNMKVLLCGEYDKNNAILTLHVGVGGTDANDWTEMLLRMYTRWCEKQGYSIETLDLLPGDEAGIKSVTLKVTGEYAYGYLKAEKGIHRLVRISPYNANGKRQTSFASMEVLPELTKEQDIEIRSDDLKIDTYRSGGAGGQHVNKTDSAVRITHIPTGIVVQCQNERSQFSNRDTAMEMLKSKLVELKERAHKEKIEDLTGELKDMGWGSQIRSYVFHPYSMVKDHRTNVETSNVTSVMDGEIDMFINAYLKQQ
ncbi:MAG: peptide chain release factor 2 [Clostridium beijerinckii]|uniref:Peptide chain release factor 2 n=3 Tax=Clostridium beijerinckii TaxID=1520 RepID=A0AB74VGU9_CLOBE|nr:MULTISPECIES: peptide chain release factor 2 [Clostridium]ALB48206.2 peptide chain release factor 2 [Clostridium beijerinckii NRRL B-598]MBC2419313.1 peptide chain release factor 2 [Clostridium beijerinckii]MBC2420668.1 peptide chain release factor 2 [Clostridium beijerinckii]MBC2431928.1 peptide chain release factor 2 [Clostridium beijerinckii]MBC2458003.1 peptide chain release factor 2 [Clostridium beijerinckii]